MTTHCPGQDRRFWKPEDITEVRCARCGAVVEFFKTDGSRACPGCGERVTNPKVALGCAQWCAFAEQCLGFDPKSVHGRRTASAALVQRLAEAVKEVFGPDRRRMDHALRVLDHARAIMAQEGGDPRVVVAAALLHDIGIPAAERKHASAAPPYQETEGPPIARRILEDLGFDARTIEQVCRIVGSHHSGGVTDSTEFDIVWDADHLVNMEESDRPRSCGADIVGRLERVFRTAAGRARARIVLPAGASGEQEGNERKEPG